MLLSTAETYRAAANEHLQRVLVLHEQGEYFLAHYLAGLAVECHLRAYLRRRTNQFDARHDLNELAKEANFYNIVPQSRIDEFNADFQTMNARWRSNHRFYSERQFLDYMNEVRAEFNQKGDRWKNLSRTLLNIADKIIRQGEAEWNNG